MAQRPRGADGYNGHLSGTAGMITGCVQFCCGISLIAATIPQFTYTSFISYSVFYLVNGVLICIPTGILGYISGKKTISFIPVCCYSPNRRDWTTEIMVGYMLMSILAAGCGGVVVVLGIIGAERADSNMTTNATDYAKTEVVSKSVAVVIGLTEMVTAIIAAAFCCSGTCCVDVSDTGMSTNQKTRSLLRLPTRGRAGLDIRIPSSTDSVYDLIQDQSKTLDRNVSLDLSQSRAMSQVTTVPQVLPRPDSIGGHVIHAESRYLTKSPVNAGSPHDVVSGITQSGKLEEVHMSPSSSNSGDHYIDLELEHEYFESEGSLADSEHNIEERDDNVK